MALATERQFGGKGANQAVAAARQGASVAVVGAVGEDAEGRAYLEHLAREGIDTAAVARCAGAATGTAHVYVDAAGENLIVVNPGANARIQPGSLDGLLPRVARMLVQLEAGTAAGVAALRKAAAAGVPALLNASQVSCDFPWGQVDIDTFSDATRFSPRVEALLPRVRIKPNPDIPTSIPDTWAVARVAPA